MKKGFTLIELMVVIGVIGLLASIVLPRFGDSTDAARAAQVHGNLHNIQEAIDMFNVGEGYYPKYGNDIGAGEDGNTFSETFEKYYSKGRMPETPAGGTDVSKNKIEREKVYKWGNDQLKGGWLYDEERGRLYARLVRNAYGQGNIWISDEELKEGVEAERNFKNISLKENHMWFTENFLDEFTFETSFKINGGGRMEIFLDVDSGGALTESGVPAVNPTGYMLRIHPIRGEMYLLKVNEYANVGDGKGKSPNTDGGKEEIIEKVDLKKLKPPIPNSVWQKNEVPISVDVKNTGNESKSLSMSIGGQKIQFTNGDTVKYPSTSQKTTVGVGTSKGRAMEVAEVTIKNK
ncbi:hypothetical protein PM10SUCC1_36870 [Propionigenium maris DSM 9537]|uniref:Prepilin-type N-terminal cleavage/methylation domain-containing protein n=1 Tax=Propionigenium maris DSM 9537 TaxID=1123000 RepID=A0A9W6LPT3_9FUSO|nr:type II secretion system protein [Propionigenium maris]GLI58173.1 hypothetical protein PM10SUCC1_36870 [Propionigenium maris DSM 9537]